MNRHRKHPSFGSRTDRGRVRPINEDAILLAPPLFAVADGLGGHEAGEVASKLALDTLADAAPTRADARALGKAVEAANRIVLAAAQDGKGREGMGTTLTAVVIEGERIALAHVGDSRAYLLSGSGLRRISQDHSMVGDMIRRGAISEDEARFHPNRNVITRALGTDASMKADTSEVVASRGDRVLLSSDGLHGVLSDPEIAEILGSVADPDDAAAALVDAANDAGGPDNISVVVVDVGEFDEAGSVSRSGRGWVAPSLWVLAALALLVAAVLGVRAYALSRAYAIDEGGVAVIYQGVPGTFAGITLSERVNGYELPVESLPIPARADLRDTIRFESLSAAEAWAVGYGATASGLTAPDALALPPAEDPATATP